jgi:transcriptional regulator with XRE-family HTH domain
MRTFRGEQGMSQSRLAELANTNTRYIAAIERCEKFPSIEMIERIATALQKDTLDLFGFSAHRNEWKEEVLIKVDNLIQGEIAKLKTHK